MSDAYAVAIGKALKTMEDYPPEPLLEEVNHQLRREGVALSEAELVDILTSEDRNDTCRVDFHIRLATWDAVSEAPWATSGEGRPTSPGTEERRAEILRALGLEGSAGPINDTFPPAERRTAIISADTVEPWYAPERARERAFYWPHYRSVLVKRGWPPAAIGSLDAATTDVVSRLQDPTRREVYQSKGLVVGYVQSGKTANFAGVIAKAIDAGYRLIIVLTGTLELLRSQTQRRLDMEICGIENVLGGISPDDEVRLREVDYVGWGDRDWPKKFVRHGNWPKNLGRPDIRRLTTANFDYQRLRTGLHSLDFRAGNELYNRALPLWDAENLHRTDVRLVVVKKNATVLGKLIKDLKDIHADLEEIPALIIDDEADQASVNTKKQKPAAEKTERTRINERLATLLGMLARAQYIGYTATPFANVFVDPEDSEDIFPKDFIVSLEAPTGYMGARAFHDLDPADDRTYANSGQKAYVRDLVAPSGDVRGREAEMQAALDSYVLAGAIKLWRHERGAKVPIDHHTMLVHETVKQSDHEILAGLIHDVWRGGGYTQSGSLRRLHDLWRDDFLPVMRARAEGLPVPEDFHELMPWIGQAVDRIERGSAPVVVVNGSNESDYKQDDIDFQRTDVWKVLVGGAKLSRGFTVEGLTTSFYTRRTQAADTLMQMGRWFGFRPGYHDLVRVFIGRRVPAPGSKTVDLYKAFEASMRDEEDFREELRIYQGLDETGRPRMRPMDVPPMVFQTLPWLKPTSRTKMFNAVLQSKGEGGRVKDFGKLPLPGERVNTRDCGKRPLPDEPVNTKHFGLVAPLVKAATKEGTFVTQSGNLWRGRYAIVPAEVLRNIVCEFQWARNFDFRPTLRFMDTAIAEKKLDEWVVVIPQLTGVETREVAGSRLRVPVIERTRRTDRGGEFSGSSPHQRLALEIIAGGVDPSEPRAFPPGAEKLREALAKEPLASRLHSPTRGAMLLTFAADDAKADESKPVNLPDPVPSKHIASVFSLAFPKLAAPRGRVGYKVHVRGGGAIVYVSEAKQVERG